MSNPGKRFFGGVIIGIFLSIPFVHTQGELFGSQFLATIGAMPFVSSEAFLASSLVLIGLACAYVGAMATRQNAGLSVAPRSTVETFRRRRQRRPGRSYHLPR